MGAESVLISPLLKELIRPPLEFTWEDQPIVHVAETVMTNMTDMMTESVTANPTDGLPLPITAGVVIALAPDRAPTLHVVTEDPMYPNSKHKANRPADLFASNFLY